jgi:DNA-binding MarR family transcriptional regulator
LTSKAGDPPPDAERALTSIFETVEFSDAYRISYLANAIVVPGYEDIKREFGIIRAEYLLLLCLAHHTALTAQEVSTMTRRPRNSISRAVHRMLAVGYLNRVPDPTDGRQSKLSITPTGRKLHEQIAQTLVAREAEVLDVLSDTERSTLRDLLQKLALHATTLDR